MICKSRFLRGLVSLAGLVLVLGGLPLKIAGQTETQRLLQQVTGQSLTQAQILDRLKASGISREQARTRLQEAGYDPSLVDPYFDQLEGRTSDIPEPGADFLRALGEAGLVQIDSLPTSDVEVVLPTDSLAGDSLAAPEGDEGRSPVFGLDVFRRTTGQFQAVVSGPVDPDYVLGPGDQIILLITGDVEAAYTLEVNRDGLIVIPDVGQVSVNGATVSTLRERLFDRLGRVYSGVRRGGDATTHFDVSLGRLRTNQVFVIGDVDRPGAYQVSSVGTVMNALYHGGGPTELGSFRRVRVIRQGNKVADVDLYEYLLEGNTRSDIRLDQGDVVFVPPVSFQVTVEGLATRPGTYEMKEGESLGDLLRFAGGPRAEADVRRIQVDRILPASERQPGRDRVLLDADLLASAEENGPAFPMQPGDRVTIAGVLDRQEGRVSVSGAVWRPGVFEFRPGMTVWELLEEADGLSPSAYPRVAHIRRQVEETGGIRLLRISLVTDDQGHPMENPPLEDLDQLVVFDREALRIADSVQISGLVKESGKYPLPDGTTVEDLILMAGGYRMGAQALRAEVVRTDVGLEWSEDVGTRYLVQIDPAVPHPLRDRQDLSESGSDTKLQASEFLLEPGDQVFIRRMPGYTEPGSAKVSGEVLFPGNYGFENRQERLSTLISRAGGLTQEGFPSGARLVRDSLPVGIDLEAALAKPGGPEDVLLNPGDEIIVPSYDPTVLVTGAVTFQSRVVFREGWGVGDFLREAGGPTDGSDLRRISVEYPSGERAVTKKFLFFKRQPRVEPGSIIRVPRKADNSGVNLDQLLNRTLSLTTTVLTILVAVDRLK